MADWGFHWLFDRKKGTSQPCIGSSTFYILLEKLDGRIARFCRNSYWCLMYKLWPFVFNVSLHSTAVMRIDSPRLAIICCNLPPLAMLCFALFALMCSDMLNCSVICSNLP